MELFLNLAWLALVVPAIWVWFGLRARGRDLGLLRSALLLGCVLTLLFPAISASDDLQPMRAEVEDASSSKRLVKQASPGHGSPLISGSHPVVFSASAIWLFSPPREIAQIAVAESAGVAPTFHPTVSPRGPPLSPLA